MKTRYLLAALPFAFTLACSEVEEDETIPESVAQAFEKMYPDAQEVEWEKEEDIWEAEFMENAHEVSAEFTAAGGWIESETTLQRNEVPAPVVQAVLAKYPNAEFLEFEEVRGVEFMAYEVEFSFEGEEMEILISGSGVILESEEENESEEEQEQEDEEA